MAARLIPLGHFFLWQRRVGILVFPRRGVLNEFAALRTTAFI